MSDRARRSRLSALAAGILSACLAHGCESGTAVDLTLHLEDVALTPSGGYWFDLRAPDGRPLEGVTERFVSWRSGEQTVRLHLSRDEHFASGSERNVRLVVWAHPAQDQPPTGHGAAFVTLSQGRSVSAEVILRPDPRPVAEVSTHVQVRSEWETGTPPTVESRGRILSIGPQGDLPEDWHWHAWFIRPNGETGDERLWLGLLDGSPLETTIEGDPLLARPFAVEVTAEAQPEPLVQPLGWRVGDGRLGDPYREALAFLLPDGHELEIWHLSDVLRGTTQHAGFSAAATNVASRQRHAEHVFNAVVGEAGEDDLDGNGSVETPVYNPAGLIPWPPEDPESAGYFERLSGIAVDVLEAHAADGAIAAARQSALLTANACGGRAVTILDEVADLSEQVGRFEATPVAEAEAMHAAALSVFGERYSDDADTDDLRALCFIERLEALSLFGLDPVPASTR